MRATTALIAMLAFVVSQGLFVSQAAHADTLPFASGVQSNNGPQCFRWSATPGSTGLVKVLVNGACDAHYYMPLYWRNFYSASTNRTVTLRGRRSTAAGKIDCGVLVYDQTTGNLLSSASAVFPNTGSNYTTVSLTVNNILSTSTAFITCTPSAGDTWLLSASWTP
jgi:hypothetical protein